MVYVTDKNTSPRKWPVGRVIAIHPDKKGCESNRRQNSHYHPEPTIDKTDPSLYGG